MHEFFNIRRFRVGVGALLSLFAMGLVIAK
jgi:hypothetical protein